MTLSHITPLLQFNPVVQRLTTKKPRGGIRSVDGVPPAASGAIIASLASDASSPILVLTPREDRADRMAAALAEWVPTKVNVHRWPAADALPYEQLPFDRWQASHRLAVLDLLGQQDSPETRIIVASAASLTRRVMSPEDVPLNVTTITPGERFDPAKLQRWLVERGYEAVSMVDEPGTFARRGGLVDLFSPGYEEPLRIDFFGDEIDSIRHFNPASQRSTTRLPRARLLAAAELPYWQTDRFETDLRQLDLSSLRPEVAAEWERASDASANGSVSPLTGVLSGLLYPSTYSLLDHLPASTLVIIDDPASVRLAAHQQEVQAEELRTNFLANGELPASVPYPAITWSDLESRLPGDRIEFASSVESVEDAQPAAQEFVAPPHFSGRIQELIVDLRDRVSSGWRVVVATDQVDRLTELMEASDLFPRRVQGATASEPPPLPPGTSEVRASDIAGGWMVPLQKLLVISDYEIFGFRKERRRGSNRVGHSQPSLATDLTPGEYVVHIDHGIARFKGLTRMEQAGVEREYMLLEYARGDKLYVPVDQSDRVTRHGAAGVEPAVTRLGTGEWVRVKRRARKAVREMAFELMQLYAAREASTGRSMTPDSNWDRELASAFPYTETADQQRAIDQVKADMESLRPMDRLLCGDVGFGKTEVALRAAFKAVNAGRQVAVLVPTTVLALQHYTTFSQRLATFPVRVEMLSRLRSANEQRQVLEDLAAGKVDVVIGTHRLVQRDVRFQDLGLVVVDEEQRFGVRQKEFLKRLRTEVDVLTMTATPIPRTLHMALAGVRDISVIESPPRDRLPIRTFVTEYDDRTIREVILREIDRGGQVYVVHNRVHDIDRLAHRLRERVPEAGFAVGHGQMDEAVLEDVIMKFVDHQFDVLISTTIIESGIDIPNVNTIVIDNADTFGLTQLYQLRGRVGRSTNRAYAYLLYRPAKVLTPEAQERLDAIQEATELGAGMRVAMRDLEIRGAGNMLGAEQSGHIEAIGFELYMRLLQQAVQEIQQGRPMDDQGPITLDLPLTALIPETYVVDTELRLGLYRRIARATDQRQLSDIRHELLDRFGPLPDEVERLLALIALRIRCRDLGIESIVEREREIVIRPVVTTQLDRRRLNSRFGPALRLTPNSVRLRLTDLEMPWQEAISALLAEIESAMPVESEAVAS